MGPSPDRSSPLSRANRPSSQLNGRSHGIIRSRFDRTPCPPISILKRFFEFKFDFFPVETKQKKRERSFFRMTIRAVLPRLSFLLLLLLIFFLFRFTCSHVMVRSCHVQFQSTTFCESVRRAQGPSYKGSRMHCFTRSLRPRRKRSANSVRHI